MRLSAATILYAIQTFLSFVKSSGHIFSKIYLASKQVQLFCAYLSCPAGCGRGAQLAQRRFLEYPVKWSVIKRKRANLVGLYVEEVNR